MRKTKKILSLLLCIVMCLSLFPTAAFADADASDEEEVEEAAAVEDAALLVEEDEAPAEDDTAAPPEEVEEAPEEVAEAAEQNETEVAEPAVPAEDAVEAQSEAEPEAEITIASVGMKLVGAAGTLGQEPWADEVATYYNYYLEARPGDEISLWVEVEADDMASVTYEWRERIIPEGEPMTSVDTGERTAVFPKFVLEDGCSYQCKINDGSGTFIYVAFDVMVGNDGPAELIAVDTVTGNSSAEVTVEPGGDTTLEVDVTADPAYGVSYAWYDINYNPLPSGEEGYGPSYTFTGIQQAGYYICEVTQGGNSCSVFFKVIVENDLMFAINGPVVYDDESSMYCCRLYAGSSATLEAVVNGGGNMDGLQYRWYEFRGRGVTPRLVSSEAVFELTGFNGNSTT